MNTRLSLLNISGRVALETATSPDEDEEQEEDNVITSLWLRRRLEL